MFFGIHFCSDRLQNGSSGRISLIRIKNQLRIFRKFIDSRIQKPRKVSMTAKLRIREGRAFIEQALYRDKSDGGDDGTVVFKIEKRSASSNGNESLVPSESVHLFTMVWSCLIWEESREWTLCNFIKNPPEKAGKFPEVIYWNTILIPGSGMLCGLPEHAVRSDPVSERVKAFCLQYHEHKYIQKNRPIQEKFRAFFYCRSA